MSSEVNSFDCLLNKLGGFGRFQKVILLLMCIPALFSGISPIAFIFGAGIPDYRCRIPQCDNEIVIEYTPQWIKNAIPFENGDPKHCSRYAFENKTNGVTEGCPADFFDQNTIIDCENNLVFPDRHTTIANEFHIYCPRNQWILSLVGTFNALGQMISSPICGFISDRYGRKTVLIVTSIICAIAGTAKSFTTSIEQYIALEFIDSSASVGVYSTTFILGIELVGPSYRLLAATVPNVCYSLAHLIVGLVAWYFSSWKIFLRILYLPGLIIISYWWLIPESIKWLISKNKFDAIRIVLNRIAKVNNRQLPDNYELFLTNEENKTKDNDINVMMVLKSRILCFRFINCCILFIISNFIYFGLSLNSVFMSGNKYANFITISSIEIPACILFAVLLNHLSRRLMLCISFFSAGMSCILLYVIPEGAIKIIIYTLGKFMATIVYSVIYIFTTELFPTCVRHSILSLCYAIGGFGTMIAPETPLLAFIWTPLPIITFGFFGILGSLLTMLFPETYNKELPDTIEESENMSKDIIITKL